MKKKLRLKRSLRKRIKYQVFRIRNIFSLLSFCLTIVFIVFLGKMNLIPNKYVVLISLVLILLDFLSIYLINIYEKKWLKIIGAILMFIITCVCSVGIYYLSSTENFLNKSFTNKELYEKNTYYVVGLSSNKYKESDISDEVSVYKETVHLKKALKKLNEKYEVQSKSYDDIGLVFDNIINKTDKFMLVEKASYEIVFSISKKYKKSDFDIIYKYDIYTKKKKSKSTNFDKFNIYIGGTDRINGL